MFLSRGDAGNPAVFVENALRQPGRPRRVVQHRVVLPTCPGGPVITACTLESRIVNHVVHGGPRPPVDGDNVIDRRRVLKCVGYGTPVVGRRNHDGRVTVVEPVGDAFRPESLVDAAPDGTLLEGPHECYIVFGDAGHVRKDPVPVLYAQVVEDGREPIGPGRQLPERQLGKVSVGPNVVKRYLPALVGVTIDCLVPDI